ncbi:MAG: MBL fold metallo-hydrolase [Pseudomonadota bacterium]
MSRTATLFFLLAALLPQSQGAAANDGSSTVAAEQKKPPHHQDNGTFINPPGSPERSHGAGEMLGFMLRVPFARPGPVPDGHSIRLDAPPQAPDPGAAAATWLGHASFLLQLPGLTVLTDPYLTAAAGPMGIGPRRFVPAALEPESLPPVDVIVVSHNHYDHLDLAALKRYPHKRGVRVIVPLGLGRKISRLGYEQVTEQDWWQSISVRDGFSITTLPAVHFSGRGLFDRNRTLWASFAIETPQTRVWFGGDTGYGEVFKEIGTRAGPFDMALVPIGAYAPRSVMRPVHVNPEEAVQILNDIGARRAIGMHWGTIMLTTEPAFEAPTRFRAAADAQNFGAANAWTLAIGETRDWALR